MAKFIKVRTETGVKLIKTKTIDQVDSMEEGSRIWADDYESNVLVGESIDEIYELLNEK